MTESQKGVCINLPFKLFQHNNIPRPSYHLIFPNPSQSPASPPSPPPLHCRHVLFRSPVFPSQSVSLFHPRPAMATNTQGAMLLMRQLNGKSRLLLRSALLNTYPAVSSIHTHPPIQLAMTLSVFHVV